MKTQMRIFYVKWITNLKEEDHLEKKNDENDNDIEDAAKGELIRESRANNMWAG